MTTPQPIVNKAGVNLPTMKRIVFLLLLCLAFGQVVFAQVPHASPEVRQKARDRADYGTFRRKINELKEFAEERKKIAKLQKENKEQVKVYATIDSVETDDTTKMKILTGYITQQVGESVANVYELTYDRAAKRITNIKKTGEGVDPEAAEPKEKATKKKPEAGTKQAAPKKKKDGDDEEGEEDTEKEEKEDKKADKEKEE